MTREDCEAIRNDCEAIVTSAHTCLENIENAEGEQPEDTNGKAAVATQLQQLLRDELRLQKTKARALDLRISNLLNQAGWAEGPREDLLRVR